MAKSVEVFKARQRVWRRLPRHLRDDLPGILTVVSLLVLWELWARGPGHSSSFATPLERVWVAAHDLARTGDLWLDFRASLARLLVGFVLGASLGLAVGAFLGVFRWAEILAGPMLSLLRQIPIFGLVPLLTLWFGTGEAATILLIATAAFFPVLLQTEEGLRNVPQIYREVARALTLSRARLLHRVLLPAALPSILTGLKHGLAFAWVAGVGSELITTGGAGIGSLLASGRTDMRMDIVLLAIVIIGATGYLLNHTLLLIERRMLRWRPTMAMDVKQ